MEQNRNKDVKHVYVRERQTDDVFRFWVAATADEIQSAQRVEVKLPVSKDRPRRRKLLASSATFALLLIATIFAAGITTTHQTLSYFNDIETSNANSLNAGILDLQINGVNFEGELVEDEVGINIAPSLSGVVGNFDMEYKVRAEKISGAEPFCALIQAHVTGDVSLQYDGALMSYVGGPSQSVSINSFDLSLPDATGVSNGDVCDIDLVYTAWAKDAVDEQGYVDEERVRITLTAAGLPEQVPALFSAFNLFSSGDEREGGDESQDVKEAKVTDDSDSAEESENRGRGSRDDRDGRDDRSGESENSGSGGLSSDDDKDKDEDKKDEKSEEVAAATEESAPPAEVPPPADPVPPEVEVPVAPALPETPPVVDVPLAPAVADVSPTE